MKVVVSGAIALLSIAVSAPAVAATSNGKMAVQVAAPAAGKSQVVFFRPGGMGMAMRCTIRENGKMVGRVGNGKYFILPVEPGKHTFTTKTEATDTLNIEAEADETQYVKCKIGMGMVGGRPNLSPAQKADFDAKSAKMKQMDAAELADAIAKDDGK